ncbi:MAG: right-handed parallel beta-helix repeat-containing protein [Coriobacteriia bacterium]|nr:right-handed parallel beta-helix repeat-containing protein [Coriobacteriia bacterium]
MKPGKLLSVFMALVLALSMFAGIAAPAQAAQAGPASGEATASAPASGSAAVLTAPAVVATAGEVCEITAGPAALVGTQYLTLDDALNQVPDATPVTIKLLTDIDYDTGCVISNKEITFDLNGLNLVFKNTGSPALSLQDCAIDYINQGAAGSFKAINLGGNGHGLAVDEGGSCELTYAETDSDGYDAINCDQAAVITVNGAVVTKGDRSVGINAYGKSQVTVNGNISTKAGHGVSACDKGTAVTVNGNISVGGVNCGVEAFYGPSITVNGNITSDGDSWGVNAFSKGTKIVINGDITLTGMQADGIFAYEDAAVFVKGNVSVPGAMSRGVSVDAGAQATIDGALTSGGEYIWVKDTLKTASDYTTPTTKAGYLTYTDGASTVWVHDPNAAPEPEPEPNLKPKPKPKTPGTGGKVVTPVGLPGTGDALRPLVIALVVFAVAVAAVIILMFIRRK